MFLRILGNCWGEDCGDLVVSICFLTIWLTAFRPSSAENSSISTPLVRWMFSASMVLLFSGCQVIAYCGFFFSWFLIPSNVSCVVYPSTFFCDVCIWISCSFAQVVCPLTVDFIIDNPMSEEYFLLVWGLVFILGPVEQSLDISSEFNLLVLFSMTGFSQLDWGPQTKGPVLPGC